MQFEIDGKFYPVEIIKKNNKNIYIRIKDKDTISITIPFLYTERKAFKILEENKKSIEKMLKKKEEKKEMEEGIWFLGKKYDYIKTSLYDFEIFENKVYAKDEKTLEKGFLKEMKRIYTERLEYWYQTFEESIPYPKLKFRKMKTRWGVCNKKDNSITLNTELLKYDVEKLDYVIVHELAHFIHFNHSPSFWLLVEKYCPHYKKIRKELR